MKNIDFKFGIKSSGSKKGFLSQQTLRTWNRYLERKSLICASIKERHGQEQRGDGLKCSGVGGSSEEEVERKDRRSKKREGEEELQGRSESFWMSALLL